MYFKDISKSESYVFRELKKNKLAQDILVPENKKIIIDSLQKVSNNEYQAKVGNNTIKFLFTLDERGTNILIRDFYINNQSIFWGMFRN